MSARFQILCSCVLGLLPGRPVAQPAADSSLVLYLPFHAGARDESIWRHPVVEHQATYGQDRFGQAGEAFYANGADAFIEIPPAPALDLTGSITLSMWLKLEEAFPMSGVQTPISRSGPTQRSAAFILMIGNVNILFLCDLQSDEQPLYLSYSHLINPGRWSHVAIVLDTVQQEGRMYIDGKLAYCNTLKLNRVVQPELPIIIGGRILLDVPTDLWKGWIDDVRLYNRALRTEAVQALTGTYEFPSIASAYEQKDQLPPGRYILVPVSAADSIIWEPRLYEVLARESVWKKSWFIGLIMAAVAAFSLLGAWFFYRQQQLEQALEFERIRALESERFRIAREMHEDIGTGLSALNLLTDMALHKNIAPALSAEIEHIAAASQQVSGRIREIVWTIDMRHDSLEHLVTYFKQYAFDFLQPAGLELHLAPPLQLPHALLPGNTRRMVFLAYKEALHNIVKHAHATRVDIGFALDGKRLNIRIRDNGRGFDPAKTGDAGNGLANMRKRMEEVGGEFRVAPDGQGTTVEFRVPL